MRRLAVLVLILGWSVTACALEEKPLTTKITSLGLFKNGLAIVQRTARVDGPGVYRVDDVPEPVHGTFWVECDAEVSTRVTQRTVEVPLAKTMLRSFQERLAGCDVVIHFDESGVPTAEGTVVAVESSRDTPAWNRRYEQPNDYNGLDTLIASPRSTGRYLLLKSKNGESYVDCSRIAYLEAKGKPATIRQRKAVLLFTVGQIKGKNATLSVTYLAKGIAWAPSYRVDISDPKTLSLRQNATLKNELEPFADAQTRLISGFPNMQFGHVVSPLSPRTTWAAFFQQLNQRFAAGNAATINVAAQQALPHQEEDPFADTEGIDLTASSTGEGVDLHYQDIGRQTMEEGDSLAMETASGKAAYDRIVEWIVPDTRQADGRYEEEYQRRNDPEKFQDAVWDAVRFRNPLGFPMTTAPAMIVANGKFNGQQMSYWVNPGEETTLHITKSLSVRTSSIEREVDNTRDLVWVGGNQYHKVTLEGALTASNHRKETVALVIRRRFSGELVSADKEPRKSLLEEGAGYVNKRNELTWTSSLKPSEEAALKYRYTLLVRN